MTSAPPCKPPTSTEDCQYGVGEGPISTVKISMPAGTVSAFRKLVGRRGMSAAINAIMEKQLGDAGVHRRATGRNERS